MIGQGFSNYTFFIHSPHDDGKKANCDSVLGWGLEIWQKIGWSESHQTPPPDSFGVDFFDKRNLLYGWSTISISTFKTRRYLALGDFRKLRVEFFKASGNLSDFKITDCSRGLPLWWQFHFTLEIFFCCASSVCWRLALPPLSAAAATQLTSS